MDTIRRHVPDLLQRFAPEVLETERFATAEGKTRVLPGQFGGPADAYRHMLWVAELSRRIGATRALAIAEMNELNSWLEMHSERLGGRQVSPSNTPEARRMDRHNNRLAPVLGERASSTAEVVENVRRAIERARAYGGTGQGDTAYWLPRREWQPQAETTDWPDINRRPIEAEKHYRDYPGRDAPSYHQRSDADADGAGGPVQVAAHMRNGHPVQAHTRALPAG